MSRYSKQEDKLIYLGKVIENSISKWEIVAKEPHGNWTLKNLSTGEIITEIWTSTIEKVMKESRAMKEGKND